MEPLDEHHPAEPEDVDGTWAGDRLERAVQQAGARAREEDPRDRVQDAGHEQLNQRQRRDHAPAGNVGPQNEICEGGADADGNGRRAQCEEEGVEGHLPEPDRGVGLAEAVERQRAVDDKGLPEEVADGDEGEVGEDRHDGGHERVLGPDVEPSRSPVSRI